MPVRLASTQNNNKKKQQQKCMQKNVYRARMAD